VNKCTAQKESSVHDAYNPLARNSVTTFQQQHLTKETIPEANIQIPATKDVVVVASSSDETPSRIQSNGTITTIPKQPTQRRNKCFTQVDRSDGLRIPKYETMAQRVARDFASTGTYV